MKKLSFIICVLCILVGSGAKNVHASTIVSGSISNDQTWSLSGSPYVVDGFLEVEYGAILTIDPGVVVKFNPSLQDPYHVLLVHGSLHSNGTPQNKVLFTSYSDDTGGDTNGDGNNSVPEDFAWGSIFIQGPGTEFHSTAIKYSADMALTVTEYLPLFDDLTFQNNLGGVNFYAQNSVHQLNNPAIKFVDNFIAIALSGGSDISFLNFDFGATSDTTVSISNDSHFECITCQFKGGNTAISLGAQSDLTLSNSSIKNYTEYGISIINPIIIGRSSEPEDIEIHISNTEISNSTRGFYTDRRVHGEIVNSAIFNNDESGAQLYNQDEENIFILVNNWWGDPSGPEEEFNNPNGLGNLLVVENTIPYSPWLLSNPLDPSSLDISSLAQYKYDGTFAIAEGGQNMSDAYVFKSFMTPSSSLTKMEVEVVPESSAFTGTNLFVSDNAVSNVSSVSVKISGITKGSYKWRARLKDAVGNTGSWVEYGQTNNIDFVANPVPHYTQNRSNFPNFDDTSSWFNLPYGGLTSVNPSTCGFTIAGCGCALTSGVMVLRYYGITSVNNEDVTPLTLNTWLIGHGGYFAKGNINWMKVAEFSGYQIKFAERTEFQDDAKLDQYLALSRPGILYVASNPALGKSGHFLVASNKLEGTYEVRDPANYDTRTLDDQPVTGKKIRDYNNSYDGLRLYKPGDGIAQNYIAIHMASPADIVVIDSDGRAAGYNPLTQEEYTEIPGSMYVRDGIDDPEGMPSGESESKTLYIPGALAGNYTIDVHGTGTGNYTLSVATTDSNGSTITESVDGTTVANQIDVFSTQVNQSSIIFDQISADSLPPQLTFIFDLQTRTLVLKSAEGNAPFTCTSELPVLGCIDRYGNEIRAEFTATKNDSEGNNLELETLYYNGEKRDHPFVSIKYGWNPDGIKLSFWEEYFIEGIGFVKGVYEGIYEYPFITAYSPSNTIISQQIFPRSSIKNIKHVKLTIDNQGTIGYEY